MTDALVLSGGSIKGAYQAGVIAGITEQGFRPDIVTGISVGALNAAWLAAHPGDGKGLADFWKTRITGPDVLVKKRGVLDLLWRIVTKRWGGAVNTDPMAKMVRETLGSRLPTKDSAIQTRVGAVNLASGDIEYYASSDPAFLDAVIASTAEPIAMPLRKIGRSMYYDGGLRDIAPLKQAIALGATRLVVVLCQPETLATWAPSGDLLEIAGRVAGIVSHEIMANDLATARLINDILADGVPMPGKRELDIRVIRPTQGFSVNVASFTAADIHRMVDQGYADGRTWDTDRLAA